MCVNMGNKLYTIDEEMYNDFGELVDYRQLYFKDAITKRGRGEFYLKSDCEKYIEEHMLNYEASTYSVLRCEPRCLCDVYRRKAWQFFKQGKFTRSYRMVKYGFIRMVKDYLDGM